MIHTGAIMMGAGRGRALLTVLLHALLPAGRRHGDKDAKFDQRISMAEPSRNHIFDLSSWSS